LRSYTIESSGEIDNYSFLYDESQSYPLTVDDYSGERYNFKIVWNLTANKTYYIKVRSETNYLYPYAIQIAQSKFNSNLASSFNEPLSRTERGVTQKVLQTYTTGVSFEEHSDYVLYDDECEHFGESNIKVSSEDIFEEIFYSGVLNVVFSITIGLYVYTL